MFLVGKIRKDPPTRWHLNRTLRVERAVFPFTKETVDYSVEKKKKKKNHSAPPSSYFIDFVNTVVISCINIPLDRSATVSSLTVGIIHSGPQDTGLGTVAGHWGQKQLGATCTSGISA